MLIRMRDRKVRIFRTMVNGKTWERTTGETQQKRAQAKIPELKRLAQLHRERPGNSLKLGPAIVREVARIEQDVSGRQAERVGDGLRRFFEFAGDIALERIDDKRVESYQRKRLQEVARSTVDKALCYLLKLMRLNGFRLDRPSPKRGKKTEVREFSQDELKRFFAHCPEKHRALFLLMLATGARPAELIPSVRSSHTALLKSEIDPEGCLVKIRSAKVLPNAPPKARTCSLLEGLIGMLLKTRKRTPGSHLFPPNQSLSKSFDRILKSAGIEKVDVLGRKLVAHSFRHTFATMMAEMVGSNPFVLKQALGHSQISTTDRYCHPQVPAEVIDLTPYLESRGDLWGTSMGNTPDETESLLSQVQQ